MCGINGILRLTDAAPALDRDELLRTRDAMTARGPDGAGAWISDDGRVALASRRLAILDLSEAGAQPMASADGRFQVVLNGEIYNFATLRRELEAEGVSFRSRSDTEVVLALYARQGAAMLGRLRGMYALAIWDEREKSLLLARDPLGIKPLYMSAAVEADRCLRFASQVKALEAGGVSRQVDLGGLAGFLLWGSVPEPLTIRKAVRALPAGHHLLVRDGEVGEPRPHAPAAIEPLAHSTAEAAVEDSVVAHLVSDVPVAVFLSAGLDSGLIAALARGHLPEPPATFTLSFDVLAGTPRDEAPLAAAVARALGTRHIERRVGRADFPGLWRDALAAMDQPSIDGFNTFVVSRAAHEAGLKVVLSGLGGDEVFGSYPSFADVPRLARLARRAGRIPGFATAWPALARLTRLTSSRPKLAGLLRYGRSLPGAYFLRRGLFLPEELPGLMGRDAAAEGLAQYDPVADAASALGDLAVANGHARDPWTAVHELETARYMRNQLLRDADWASMASSVELRVPFVDAWLRRRLAAQGFEPARGRGKGELVRRAAPELPAALLARPKTGFYVPVMEWLQPGEAGAPLGDQSRRLARRVLAEFGAAAP
ncbi:MAG TPA: asparagine synthase (glutamine-hydrolyzing) [Thermoanaerobaculia bacterium]|jgi:asparagine synthase (glutamine-hydrolysing)|nr:asparagine synthase (glutamine-hydrolyzing) [Thermoanaerobaculia bacterium]